MIEVAQSNDRRVGTGLLLVGFAAAGYWFLYRDLAGSGSLSAVWLLLLAAVLVLMLLGGLYFLVTRPTRFIFDRPGGELIVGHRTLVWRSERRYPLSAIRFVEIRETYDLEDEVTGYRVWLQLVTPDAAGGRRRWKIELTGWCISIEAPPVRDPIAMADVVAAFVGVPVQWT